MTLYDIVNMSDSYTIEASSLDVAFVACITLGDGQYAFEPIEPEEAENVPIFMLGGVEEWCKKKFDLAPVDVVERVHKEKRDELATCLESCVIGSASDRKLFFKSLELIDDLAKREVFKAEWHDKKRSSLNDIGKRAILHAKRLRQIISKELKS